MNFSKLTTIIFLVVSPVFIFSQRGKNGDFTIPSAGYIANAYTSVTADAAIGATSVTVASNTLNSGFFTTNLQQGDLVMIIQMQGASPIINLVFSPIISGPGSDWQYDNINFNQHGPEYGNIGSYNNAGTFELREVLSVTGTNTINFTCQLQHAFATAGHTQIIRVPRFQNLTLGASTTITCPTWNGTSFGIVALEVNGNLVFNTGSSIDVKGKGFRPGVATNLNSTSGSTTQHTDGAGNGNTYLGTNSTSEGSAKGEGIVGFTTEYTPLIALYGRGAMANGGGGAGYQNAGGGGGSNIGNTAVTHTGKGKVNASYNTSWNLEDPAMVNLNSPGGGRGGYTIARNDLDELTVGPNISAWGGDARKQNGGYGGHALQYDVTKMFLGGGGGAGGHDSNQGGSGGTGGGIAFVTVYGSISGTGSVQANGQNGANSNPTGASGSGGTKGNDGAGGGGGGGFIYIKNANAIPATITLSTTGGNGGDQDLRLQTTFSTSELGGPGAGGAGGGIAYTSGSPVTAITGGNAGSALRGIGGTMGGVNPWVPNFPVNGATDGGSGLSAQPTTIYNIITVNDTICLGESGTLTASYTGANPGTFSWYGTQFTASNATPLATGNSFTPNPMPTVTTTYYVKVCPGNFTVPVKLVVGQSPTITGTAVVTDATCNTQGSITGLSATGGVAPLTYSWNGTTTPTGDLTSASPNNYILTVTDGNGCSSQSSQYTINGAGGPVISGTAVITPATCTANGSISGLSATGTGTLTYSWSGTSTPNANYSAPGGSYTLTVTDGNGCSTMSGPYTIGTTAGPTITGTVSIQNATCTTNGSITGLSATGVATLTYSWSGTSTPNANYSAGAGTYTLTVTDGNGCSATSGPHIIGTTPAQMINGTAVITNATCTSSGAITGLTTSGGATPYTFSWNGVTSTNENLTGAISGNYTLSVTDGNGCVVTSGPYLVDTIAGPTLTQTVPLTIIDATCTTGGSIAGLGATGGVGPYIYAWNSTITPTANLTNAIAGQYTLTIADQNGCIIQSGPYTINVTGGPAININNILITNEACGQGNGSITGITVSGGTPNYTYSWDGNITPNANLTGLTTGDYTLTVTDAGGCSATSGPHHVTNIPAPTIDDANAIITVANCNGVLGSITGITASGNNLVYQYSNNGGTNLNATGLIAGNYSLVVTDQVTGCSATSGPYIVGGTLAPVIDATNVAIVNANCNGTTGSITGLTATGTGNLTYTWTNSTLQTIGLTGLSAGTYELTVTDDATGCTDQSGPYTVNYIGGPTANFSFAPTEPNTNETVVFTDQSTGLVIGWTWIIEAFTSSNQNESYVFTAEGIQPVTLIVVDQNGCTSQITLNVQIFDEIEVPNVITANFDGVNDSFEIKGLKPNTDVLILNRWGEEVWHNANYSNEWIGKDKNGLFVSDGVYTYIVTPANGSQKLGFVHVVRNN